MTLATVYNTPIKCQFDIFHLIIFFFKIIDQIHLRVGAITPAERMP